MENRGHFHPLTNQPQSSSHLFIEIPNHGQTSMHRALIPLINTPWIGIRKSARRFDAGKSFDLLTVHGGAPVFTAEEELGCCTEYCIGQNRQFLVTLSDPSGRPQLLIEREMGCCNSYCGALKFGGVIVVKLAETGQLLGKIKMDFSMYTPTFTISNSLGQTVLNIQGPTCGSYFPTCTFGCGGDAQFFVQDGTGTVSGIFHQVFLDRKSSGVRFDPNLPPDVKALLVGALFGIKYTFYEHWNLCSCKRGYTGMEFCALFILLVAIIFAVVLFFHLLSM